MANLHYTAHAMDGGQCFRPVRQRSAYGHDIAVADRGALAHHAPVGQALALDRERRL
jgi:hypothetical protein